MIRKTLIVIFAILSFLISPTTIFAITDPLSVSNNKYGIHITSENDLEDAAKLVNSSGGEWGYVTFVITESERDKDRWQKVFDQARRLRLIPIVRLATKANEGNWEKPKVEEINNWIAFLNSLNWVIKNRYIIISNEPNHAYEWGGEIKPDEYAKYLKEFTQKLKASSDDFFVLPAAMDASANNSSTTMESSRYLKEMNKAEPDVFNTLDGWNSHSYPNPAFSGLATDQGKGTITSYEWEEVFLRTLGVTKELPVFITETGWSRNKLSEDQISERYKYAFEKIWNNKKIVAVTPFILNYPQEPFGHFSWKSQEGIFYKNYSELMLLPKVKGEPEQITKGEVLAGFTQPVIISGGNFAGAILARNTGQSIWNSANIGIGSDSQNFNLKNFSVNDVEPMKLGLIIFRASAPETTGIYSSSLFLTNKSSERVSGSFKIEGIVTKIDLARIGKFFGELGAYILSIF